MLRQIQVEDVGFVRSARLEFGPGLTVITGESGSGKSVLLDALGFVTGRASLRAPVRSGQSEGILTATFELNPLQKERLAPFFDSLGLVPTTQFSLRRVISRSGRTKSYLNGQSISKSELSSLGGQLILRAEQGQAAELRDPRAQLELLDEFCGLRGRAHRFASEFEALRALEAEAQALRAQATQAEARLDLLSYQARELEDVPASTYEQMQTRIDELKELTDSRALAASAVLELRPYPGHSTADALRRASRLAQESGEANVNSAATLLREAETLTKTALSLLQTVLEPREADEELEELKKKVKLVEDLARKYRICPSLLAARRTQLQKELQSLEEAAPQASRKEAELEAMRARLINEARALHLLREERVVEFEALAQEHLESLDLGAARLELELTSSQELNVCGYSRLRVLFVSSPRHAPAPLSKVASGGEASRILLALLCCPESRPETFLLDEIDSGTGGQAGKSIGQLLHRIGLGGQILCVTHNPAIAALAQAHVRTSKFEGPEGSLTELTQVDGATRLAELARMLGGGEAALAYATALLDEERETNATPTERPGTVHRLFAESTRRRSTMAPSHAGAASRTA